MRVRALARRLRRHLLLILAGPLGAAIVVLPAVAGSETAPTIEAYNAGYAPSWKPAAVTISAGGAVTFENASGSVPHGVVWDSVPETPSCSAVPINKGETSWKGACTFTQAGVYAFHCYVHPEEMKGTVTVNGSGTTTSTQTTGTGGPSGSTQPATSPSTPPPGSQSSSPLAGSAATAVKLAKSQRGAAVRGSVAIASAGAGGRLEVDLVASGASLASARRVRVGRLVVLHLRSRRVAFSVPLNARARRALHHRGRLPLNVRVTVTPQRGAAVAVARHVLVHA